MESHEFEIFVRRCHTRLLHTARFYLGDVAEVEDIVQETLLKLYTMRDNLDKYRSLDALATTIVRHQAIDALRKKRRYPEHRIERDLIASEESTDERTDEILRLIEGLPSKQQLILRMKHIEGMETEEIATLFKMSIDAVYQNLSRARRAILKQFKTE